MIVSELFIPKRRLVMEDEDVKQAYIELYNGKKNVYESVYSYVDEVDAKNVIVDKIFLDFDYSFDLCSHRLPNHNDNLH